MSFELRVVPTETPQPPRGFDVFGVRFSRIRMASSPTGKRFAFPIYGRCWWKPVRSRLRRALVFESWVGAWHACHGDKQSRRL
jgi:hypothetical protein